MKNKADCLRLDFFFLMQIPHLTVLAKIARV